VVVAGSAPENCKRHQVPAIFGPFAADMLELAMLRAGEGVLDVATGQGVAARLAAEVVDAGGRVIGLDLNAGSAGGGASTPASRGCAARLVGG
jgi:protein-L-isoaspartate O-methyltransferase